MCLHLFVAYYAISSKSPTTQNESDSNHQVQVDIPKNITLKTISTLFQFLNHSCTTRLIMTFLNRIFKKQNNIFNWIFTTLIVGSALYLIFDHNLFAPPRLKITDKKKKTKSKKDTRKTDAELLNLLAKHQIFPDVKSTTREQLHHLVNQVQKL